MAWRIVFRVPVTASSRPLYGVSNKFNDAYRIYHNGSRALVETFYARDLACSRSALIKYSKINILPALILTNIYPHLRTQYDLAISLPMSTWHNLNTYIWIIHLPWLYYTDSDAYYYSRTRTLAGKYRDVNPRCMLRPYSSVALFRYRGLSRGAGGLVLKYANWFRANMAPFLFENDVKLDWKLIIFSFGEVNYCNRMAAAGKRCSFRRIGLGFLCLVRRFFSFLAM